VRRLRGRTIKRSGFLLDDKDILFEVSHSFCKQYLCGTTLTKDGKLSGKAHISKDRMQEMNEEMTATIKTIANGILHGQMSPSPLDRGSDSHCETCPMKSVCRSAHKFNN
jgi:ATP-dependent helicase/DNAse subunit B